MQQQLRLTVALAAPHAPPPPVRAANCSCPSPALPLPAAVALPQVPRCAACSHVLLGVLRLTVWESQASRPRGNVPGLAINNAPSLLSAATHPAFAAARPHARTGPPPRWLIGNLLEIHTEGQEGAAERWVAEYGPLFLIWLGGFPVSGLQPLPMLMRALLRRRWRQLLKLCVGHSI